MTLSRTSPRGRQRWTLLGAVVVALTLIGAIAAQAQVDTTLFELDKDATNNTVSVKIGVLNAAVSSATTANTIQVCQDQSAGYTGTILIDAERMTLGAVSNLTGGGCPTGFTFKRSYAVTRPVDGTVRGAHAKAENVTRLVGGNDTSMPGDDWDQVYDALTPPGAIDDKCLTLGAAECSWTHDERGASIFTSSKDYDEIDVWQWRDQSVPDANELDDGFAVKYVDGDGDQHLFFGADRFATEGAKDAGFWFFRDTVSPNPLPPDGGDGDFEGLHTAPEDGGGDLFCNPAAGGIGGPSSTPNCAKYDANDKAGDVLVLTTFTNGGAVTTIRIFEWIGPAGTTAALLPRGTEGDCVPFPTDPADQPAMCATVNDTTVESPWTYSGKGEPALDEIAAGGFLEGGINLSDLGLEGCFSSFMATTRSAPSLTADPKDFILGNFEACDSSLTTTPKDGGGGALDPDSDEDNLDEITIGTDGTVEVTDSAVLVVLGTDVFTGDLNFFLCGPIANPAACDEDGVEVGAGAGVNPVIANGTYSSASATITEVGRYCWYATFESATKGLEAGATDGTIESPGDPDADPPIPYSTGECFEVLPATPTLTTTSVECEEVIIDEETEETDVVCEAVGGPIDFGDELFDQANLQGTANKPGSLGDNETYPTINPTVDGDEADGTITFKLYGPLPTDTEDENYAEDFAAACSTLAEGFPAAGIDVDVDNGDGLYNTFGSGFAPSAPGLYAWKAEYSGDPPNTTAAPLDADGNPTQHNVDCDDPNEAVTVRQIPTEIRTAQSWFPNDTAQIKSSVAGDDILAGGTVDFYLYSNADCTGTLLFEERVTIAAGHITGGVATVSTSNYTGSTGKKTDGTTTVAPYKITTGFADAADSTKVGSWKVVYTPAGSDTAHLGRQSACTTGSTEKYQITYTNDNSGGS